MSQDEGYTHASTQPVLHTRKLCSCNALLVQSTTDAVTADASVPDTSLFGVILLNSPANTEEDFGSYIRIFERHRGRVALASCAGTEKDKGTTPVSRKAKERNPYFICADGAYAALGEYCAKHYSSVAASSSGSKTEDQSTFTPLRLCDALIGDMDSLPTTQLMRVAEADSAEVLLATADGSEPPHGGDDDQGNDRGERHPLFHENVNSIPVKLLEAIRRRRDAYSHREAFSSSRTPVEPLTVLPVACQMTTDFEKCVMLLQRLWALDLGMPGARTREDSRQGFNQEVPLAEQSHEATSLAVEYVARLPETSSTADVQAGGDQQEARRCRRLVESVTPSSSGTTEQATHRLKTRVLPNVAVLGALGGRIDHEIGIISCLLRYARVFHIMAINKYNVLFACWPDGVTQFVLPPSWSPPRPAPGATAAPYMCGVVPFGPLRELETAGLLWNVVKGRPEVYDGYTQTNSYRLAFDGLVSTCNTVTSPVVTIDVRPLHCAPGQCSSSSEALTKCNCDPDAPSVNPPTLFTLGLPSVCPESHADVPASK
ncbi:thiamin pyrophosphokinase, putative [Leishmania panamensis]|uniref:Thiamine pyrophosphokinase, putative n=1 Tax=Leishmania panamensis TaxID=5679 RepID=A0A088RMS6_LEIPA|nr:thiamin pyrophosphokinase, putative [Leishmania panamensis]AIN96539.1 thiamin pyrophosphokinase, putative [Leishmania panamensis]